MKTKKEGKIHEKLHKMLIDLKKALSYSKVKETWEDLTPLARNE